MKLHLADTDSGLVENWQLVFADFREVTVLRAEILCVARECVVLPADDRGVLLAERNRQIAESIFCPGLGTGIGGIPAESVAEEMARAYAEWREGAARPQLEGKNCENV